MSEFTVRPIRPGERAVPWSEPADAALVFIGRIHTPWTDKSACPRQGSVDGPPCRIEVFPPWDQALEGIEDRRMLDIFYWLHRSRRDLVLQHPPHRSAPCGTFAIRSPLRPNPIGVSTVALERVEGNVLHVRGLDCLDGTPLIDIKPVPKPVPTDFAPREPAG